SFLRKLVEEPKHFGQSAGTVEMEIAFHTRRCCGLIATCSLGCGSSVAIHDGSMQGLVLLVEGDNRSRGGGTRDGLQVVQLRGPFRIPAKGLKLALANGPPFGRRLFATHGIADGKAFAA